MDIPDFIYGTAWKEERTKELVLKALKAGFRAIDTANQRVHYFEELVGHAIKESKIKRKDLFLQTKYTYASGQDRRIPYNITASFKDQVKQSFESSLKHLQTDYIDSYVLHGPSSGAGLTETDRDVWQAMEQLHKDKKVKYLGVSNVNVEQLKLLYELSSIKPSFVQNRCYANMGWDKYVRDFCKEKNIIYQGFSLLTANLIVLASLGEISAKYKKTPAQIIFQFSKQIGMLPLTGTTSEKHMKEDLDLNFKLNEEEIEEILLSKLLKT